MYLFTISYGSYAVDQRSGDGWIGGWSQIFAFYERNSWSRLWVARREDCFSTEQNHPEYPLQEKNCQSGGAESPRKRTISFEEDRSLTWSTSTSRSLGPMILSRIMPTYSLLVFEMTTFRNSIRFEMGRNIIVYDENPTWWHHGKLVQIKNTRVWETQDRIGIVWPGDSSEELRKVKGQNQDLRCQSGPSAKESVIFSRGDSSKNYGADQLRLQISDLHFDMFPTPATFACWKIRFKTEVCTCSQFSYGSYAMDQRNGNGWFSGRFEIFVFCKRYFNAEFLKYSMRGLLRHWTKSSIIPSSKEESVWRNKRPRSRTVSFAVGRLFTWSTITSGSLGPMILSRIMQIYSLSVYEMTIYRNSTQSGTEFYCQWQKFRLVTSWKDCTN